MIGMIFLHSLTRQTILHHAVKLVIYPLCFQNTLAIPQFHLLAHFPMHAARSSVLSLNTLEVGTPSHVHIPCAQYRAWYRISAFSQYTVIVTFEEWKINLS